MLLFLVSVSALLLLRIYLDYIMHFSFLSIFPLIINDNLDSLYLLHFGFVGVRTMAKILEFNFISASVTDGLFGSFIFIQLYIINYFLYKYLSIL